jgi:hypothetical protein
VSFLLAFLGSSIGKYVLSAGFALIAVVGVAFQRRLAGAKAERAKAAAAEAKAASEAQEIDDAVAGRAPDDNRGRLGKWARS